MDRVPSMNKEAWEQSVRRGRGSTKPSLDLDTKLVRQYARGEVDPIPDDLFRVFPPSVLEGIAGRDVLCLASGGGQQTPIFGLLGARLTVLDLADGQLQGDRIAASHYGCEVRTVQGDMRDLAGFDPHSFDVVHESTSCWVPDIRVVYQEVRRVLRSGGLYRVDFANSLGEFSNHPTAKDGKIPYSVKEMVYEGERDCIQFRHHLSDIFNGLIAADLTLKEVIDRETWFVVLARRGPEALA